MVKKVMQANIKQNQNFTSSDIFAESFSAWEIAGRGWQIFDYETRIEPPYSKFVPPRRISRPVDDNRVPGFFGRLLRTNTNPVSNDQERADDCNNPRICRNSCPQTASFLIYLPKELKTSSEQIEQFLLNLSSTASFIALEIIGTNERIYFQITCPSQEKKAVLSQLKNHLPNVDFRETDDVLRKNLKLEKTDQTIAVDFGLRREWFIPLPFDKSFSTDTLLPLIASLEGLLEDEVACLQVIFSRTCGNWQSEVQEAIFDRNGKLAFVNLQIYLSAIKDKLSNALFAAVVRFAVQSDSREKSLEIARRTRAFFRQFSAPSGNELIPLRPEALEPDRHLHSFLSRTTYRAGMLVSAQELSSICHLPSDSVISKKLSRSENRTKLAPEFAIKGGIILGENHHNGEKQIIRLSDTQRTKHLWLTGSSGSGKTSLIDFLIEQDMQAGKGITVIEPHGDSIENLLSRVPKHRLNDVVFFDPGDEFPIGFNILQANSEIEKILLSSDLTAIFRRFSSSWGDVINNVLHNSILAFLSSTKGGTLVDLKHFLVDKNFREEFIETVEDEEIRFYWLKEFPQLIGKPHAPLLTRLDLFLRSKLIRNIIAQKENKLDFRQIMDERKILLVKLTHGAIGEENAHLLGSLIMTKLYQAALSRQNVPETERVNHFIYLDEAHHFITESLPLLLSGGRKFSCSLLFSNQETKQITSRDAELLSSLQTNCYTRICFRTDSDAEMLAKGFSFFTAEHLKNLGVGECLVRLEQSRFDFNLKTFPLEPVSPKVAEQRRRAVVEHSRNTYGRSKEKVEAINKQTGSNRVALEQPETYISPRNTAAVISDGNQLYTKLAFSDNKVKVNQGRGGQHHQEIQKAVKRVAESNGFSAQIEKSVAGGSVDVSLENKDFKIAVEVSVTSSADYEIKNIRKCLDAEYDFVAVVISSQKDIFLLKEKIQTSFAFQEQRKVKVFGLTGLLEFLWQLTKPEIKKTKKKSKGDRLNIAEASEFLGISTSTLYRWAREGRVPFYRVGRGYHFDRDELALVGRHDLSGKRKAAVDLPPIEIKKRTSKSKKDENERYRKMLGLD